MSSSIAMTLAPAASCRLVPSAVWKVGPSHEVWKSIASTSGFWQKQPEQRAVDAIFSMWVLLGGRGQAKIPGP
jgi:hypothetical protein